MEKLRVGVHGEMKETFCVFKKYIGNLVSQGFGALVLEIYLEISPRDLPSCIIMFLLNLHKTLRAALFRVNLTQSNKPLRNVQWCNRPYSGKMALQIWERFDNVQVDQNQLIVDYGSHCPHYALCAFFLYGGFCPCCIKFNNQTRVLLMVEAVHGMICTSLTGHSALQYSQCSNFSYEGGVHYMDRNQLQSQSYCMNDQKSS